MGTIFSLRTIQCPACGARLPVDGRTLVVACEYCDARVEVLRRSHVQAPPPAPPPSAQWGPAPPRHVAQPHYSGLAWALLIVPIAMAGFGVFAFFFASDQAVASKPATVSETTRPVTVPPRQLEPASDPPPPPIETPASDPPAIDTPPTVDTPSSRSDAPSSGGTTSRKHTPKAPANDLPAISVAEARKVLEPKVRACMQKAKAHHLLAYMGNKTAGPVKLLSDSRTRVDGAKVSLAKTPLGRCIDEAGHAVRTSAFKSNYVILDVRNDGVPDPLGHLPKTADLDAVRAKIATHDDAVKACARKHGVDGSRAVFMFKIDGPTGKPSVSSTYLSKAFRTCATAIYEKDSFPRVQKGSYSITYTLQV